MRRPLLLCFVLVALLGAGCSVSKESHPRAISPDQLPAELRTPTTVVPTSVPTGPTLPIYIYDPQAERLHAIDVAVDERTPDAVLQALVSTEQVKDPFTTDIPAGMTIGKTSLTKKSGCPVGTGNTLRIPVSKELSTLQGDQQRVAVAQLVYTATQFPDIDCVSFRIIGSGGDVEVPTEATGGTGTIVKRADYSDIAPKS